MTYVVGLSGGVDSSLSVERLLEAGHEVVAVTLVMSREGTPSPSPEALERARETCRRLGVRHVVKDVTEAFEREVIRPFVDGYLSGTTPSPCVGCNRSVKVRSLLEVADEVGAERVATGHYVRRVLCDDGVVRLARAEDSAKDQSYFLCELSADQIERLDAPLAELTKDRTRLLAAEAGLPAAHAKDSQGVCFAPAGEYRAVLAAYSPDAFVPGDFVDEEGAVLGRHGGVAGFTVGQRKGIGLAGGPWYVKAVDAPSRTVTIVRDKPAPVASFTVAEPRLTVVLEGLAERGALVQTRYRARPVKARYAWNEDGTLEVEPLEPGVMAAPGQTAAFYQGDVVLGGGTITAIKYD